MASTPTGDQFIDWIHDFLGLDCDYCAANPDDGYRVYRHVPQCDCCTFPIEACQCGEDLGENGVEDVIWACRYPGPPCLCPTCVVNAGWQAAWGTGHAERWAETTRDAVLLTPDATGAGV